MTDLPGASVTTEPTITAWTTETLGDTVTEGPTVTDGAQDLKEAVKVDLAHRLTYSGVLPVLVTLGVLINFSCIWVLRRPVFRGLQAKRYFQLLAWGDLVLCLAYLPITVSTNGCTLYCYWFAWYFAHLGWSVPSGLHAFCTYTLTWLALDRCLAVWWHPGYAFIQRSRVQQWRALGTAAFCLVIHIPVVVDGEVVCSGWGMAAGGEAETDQDCRNGTWITSDGFHSGPNVVWHTFFIRFYNVVVRWGPDILLVAFNLSLVVAVWQGRVHSHTGDAHAKEKQQQGALGGAWERALVFTLLTMSTFYLTLTLPIAISQTQYTSYKPDRCYTNGPKETLRQVGHCLQLVEHLVHPVFLFCFNPTFRRELRLILRLDDVNEGLSGRPTKTQTLDGLTDVNI